jgi:hypothetical protein
MLEQVEQETLGVLQSGAVSGSVVLYSSDLAAQALNAICCNELKILESWGNGTNTEVTGTSRGSRGGLCCGVTTRASCC